MFLKGALSVVQAAQGTPICFEAFLKGLLSALKALLSALKAYLWGFISVFKAFSKGPYLS